MKAFLDLGGRLTGSIVVVASCMSLARQVLVRMRKVSLVSVWLNVVGSVSLVVLVR